jgi:hypothetical protein
MAHPSGSGGGRSFAQAARGPKGPREAAAFGLDHPEALFSVPLGPVIPLVMNEDVPGPGKAGLGSRARPHAEEAEEQGGEDGSSRPPLLSRLHGAMTSCIAPSIHRVGESPDGSQSSRFSA